MAINFVSTPLSKTQLLADRDTLVRFEQYELEGFIGDSIEMKWGA
jgi:hypothetical protein